MAGKEIESPIAAGQSATGEWLIRPYRESDIPALVALFNTINKAYSIDFVATEDEIRRQLTRPGLDLSHLMLVAESTSPHADGLALAGSVRAETSGDHESGKRSYELRLSLLPSLEDSPLRPQLFTRLLHAMKEHVRAYGGENETAARAFVRSDFTTRVSFWEGLEMRETRQFWHMRRILDGTIDEPQEVPGLKMHTYRSPQDEDAAFEAGLAAFADHYDFDPARFEEEWKDWNARPQTRFDLSWVAAVEDEPGKIAAFCICYVFGKEDEDGKKPEILITYVGTIREWRRKGVARNLLLHSLRSCREAGYPSVVLNVDGESLTSANRVYESVGFYVTERFLQYEALLSDIRV